MYLDPVNEGIEHGVRQLVTVAVLFDQGQKPMGVRFLGRVLPNLVFQFLYPAFQKDLFFIVLLDHTPGLPLRQYTFHGTLVQILNHGVQFSYPFSGFFQLVLAGILAFGFVFIPDALEIGYKLLLVFQSIPADSLNCL